MAQRPSAAGTPPVSIDEAVQRSLALLQANLTPQGILAASPTEAAVARRYTRIFGRDAAICSLAMVGSGVPALERGARDSLDALAAQQAGNGQIPKYVDPEGRDADFWYLGCIDATLWWLLAADDLRRRSPLRGVAQRWRPQLRRAIDWLRAQEHPHFGLLQQNEASDWADIMPRSGYVLYSNALWFAVKQRFGLAGADVTRHHAEHLFHPFQRDLPDYHRARLLQHYTRRGRRDPGLYLSFVNFASAGDEGDVFGNLLAITCGLAGGSMGQRIVATLRAAHAADPWPSARRAAPADAQRRAVAGLHGAPPAEPPAPVPQRRPVALRRRLVGDGAGPARTAQAGAARAAGAGAGQRRRRLALHRVVPRPHAGADGHGRPELERGDADPRGTRARHWLMHAARRATRLRTNSSNTAGSSVTTSRQAASIVSW
jgi:hypothetical protein